MLQRFDNQFLRDFRDPITINPKAVAKPEEVAPPPPPPPTFSEEDVEQARVVAKKLGYAEGFEAGLSQANTETTAREKDMATALASITQQLQKLSAGYAHYMTQQTTEVSELALLIAKKVAEDALDARGAEVITGLVNQCLPLFLDKPKVTIELNESLLDSAKEAIEGVLKQNGFEGEIQFRANNALQKHDARVDWTSGQAIRSMEKLWSEIEALIFQTKPNQ